MGDGADTATNLLFAQESPIIDRRAATDGGTDGGGQGFEPFGSDGLTFRDLLDIVNPLQHIPIISTIYRKLTGDTIDPASRVAGGAVFGGVIGAAVSAVNALVAETTGRDLGDHVAALFTGDEPGGTDVQIAGDVPEADTAAALTPSPSTARETPPPSPPVEVITWDPTAELSPAAATPSPTSPPKDTIAWKAPPPAGSTAPLGGWFSDAMLSALSKYKDAARLSQSPSSPSVDTLN
jgi:hypothetical protein